GPAAALTVLAALPAPAPAADASGAANRAAGIRRHTRALFEPQLSFGHDDLSWRQPLLDHEILIHALRRRDRALFDGGIGLDDEHVLAVLSGLNRLLRHDDRVRQRGEAQRDARELAGPQATI